MERSRWGNRMLGNGVTKNQVIKDWMKLFPNFSKSRSDDRKRICLQIFNGPILKYVYLDFRGDTPYTVTLGITCLIHETAEDLVITSNRTEQKMHNQQIITLNGKFAPYYICDFEGLMNDCRKKGINFLEPISVTQVFNLYKSTKNLKKESTEAPALLAVWAGMKDLTKEASAWAEEYYEKKYAIDKSRTQPRKKRRDPTFEEWREDFRRRLADRDQLQKTFRKMVDVYMLDKTLYENILLE